MRCRHVGRQRRWWEEEKGMSWVTESASDNATLAEEARKQKDDNPGSQGSQGSQGSGGGRGRSTGIISCMSINPRALLAVREMNSNLTFGSLVLTRVQEEAIATTVAAANECRY
jgi:hypothetical protein